MEAQIVQLPKIEYVRGNLTFVESQGAIHLISSEFTISMGGPQTCQKYSHWLKSTSCKALHYSKIPQSDFL